MSDVTLREVSPALQPGTISVGLLELRPGADPIAVRDRLRERLSGDVLVMTRDEYIEREKEYWARRTPIGFVLTAGLLVGFAVGSVIVYQILYTDVLDHLHEYATLKAIGYTDRQLVSVVFQQSFILSAIGFLPGLGLAAVVYHLIREMARLPADLTVGRAVAVLALTIVDVRGGGSARHAQAGRRRSRRGVLMSVARRGERRRHHCARALVLVRRRRPPPARARRSRPRRSTAARSCCSPARRDRARPRCWR